MASGISSAAVTAPNDDRESKSSLSGKTERDEQLTGEDAVRTVTNQSEAQPITIRRVAPLVLVLTGATFLVTLGAQSVVIILPVMSQHLHIPQARQQWIVSAFALTSGCFLLLSGKLGDVYGRRLLFILGCFFITACALGAAFSPTEICLYVMRALHGVGCAVTIPTAIGIIGYTIPPGRVKNYSFAFYSGGAPIGQVTGNILGGVISQYSNWKVVFYVLSGASFVVGATAIFVIPKDPPRKPGSEAPQMSDIDWTGGFLFTTGLLLLLIALSEGVSDGWDRPIFISFIIISIVLLVSFIFWERYLEEKTTRDPVMGVSTFRNARFSSAMVIVMFFSAAFTNFLVYSTYFYQEYQELSTIQTTLRFIPLGVVGIFSTLVSGFLLDRVNGNYILIFGLTSASIANLLFAVPIPPSTTYWAYGFPAMVLSAIGADTIYPCLGLFTTQALPRKDQGVGGAIFQTMAAIGRAIGLVIATAIQTAVQGHSGIKPAFLRGLRAAEWFCFASTIVALAFTVVGLRSIGKIGKLKKLGVVQGADKVKVAEV